jgi:hypothetical protein
VHMHVHEEVLQPMVAALGCHKEGFPQSYLGLSSFQRLSSTYRPSPRLSAQQTDIWQDGKLPSSTTPWGEVFW